jgi:hypothetical protein
MLREAQLLRLVFVHGVGDHCPGYAFGRGPSESSAAPLAAQAWLNENTMPVIGLRSREDIPAVSGKVEVRKFLPGKSSNHYAVQYRVRRYTWSLPSRNLDVEAIEITWSPLTQWIKSNQLGYDSPSVPMDTDPDPKHDCAPRAVGNHEVFPPLRREWLNTSLKETVLDRDLADALIYVGTYGSVISHGVADALCHAITHASDDHACQWPQFLSKAEQSTNYVFVTHSLGSRIVYDMFLDLTAKTYAQDNGGPVHFTQEEWQAAKPFVSPMLGRTQAFYMMANQLPMLGLARMTERDSEVAVNPKVRQLDGEQVQPNLPSFLKKSELPDVPQSPVEQIALARSQADPNAPTLHITAFSDLNDLLTWPLPKWYTTDAAVFTNVIVRNSYVLPVLIESPMDAHNGYFQNAAVWQVIYCGGKRGHVTDCKPH